MNLFLTNIERLDHKNVYMIKKMIGALLVEFYKAIESGNKQQANSMRELAKKIHTKIAPNILWARKVDKTLNEMARKLNK